MSSRLFSSDRSVYWPAEYEPVIEFLKKPVIENPLKAGASSPVLFKYNANIIAFAACVGATFATRRQLGKDKKEIPLSVFESNKIEAYIYLVPLMAEPDLSVEIMKNEEGEELSIKIFEEYAAGGLEILDKEKRASLLHSPDVFLEQFLKRNKFAFASESTPPGKNILESGIKLFE